MLLFYLTFFFFERNPQELKESLAFFLVFSCGNKGYCQTENIPDILIRGLWKNGMLFDADSQVADIVHRGRRNTPKVFGAWKSHVDQLFQKSVHSFASQ